MSTASFDVFREELLSLGAALNAQEKKQLRDAELRERIRNCYRIWVSVVSPELRPLVKESAEFYKLEAELSAFAKLTTKNRPVADYRKRLKRIAMYTDSLILYLPISPSAAQSPSRGHHDLFLEGIPDVPLSLVPNSLIGWKSQIGAFVSSHPFDKSIFVMIRYRDKNKILLSRIKKAVEEAGLFFILASDHSITDDLYNPIACLLCCSKGIAIFDEPEDKQVINPNVSYELGMMNLLGRNCLILKHKNLKILNSDILMKLYRSYESGDGAVREVTTWLNTT